MPYINVKITKDGTSVEQKKQIVEEMTQTLVKVLGKKPEHIHIVIDEDRTGKLGLRRNIDDGISARKIE